MIILSQQEKPRLKLQRHAVISECGRYRYLLTRRWGRGNKIIVWMMLNPSTADALVDDLTVESTTRISKNLRYDELIIVNLFGLRATDPTKLNLAEDPIGPENVFHISQAIVPRNRANQRTVVVAWGANGQLRARKLDYWFAKWTENLHIPLYCIGMNADGSPKHPLYARADSQLIPWTRRLWEGR